MDSVQKIIDSCCFKKVVPPTPEEKNMVIGVSSRINNALTPAWVYTDFINAENPSSTHTPTHKENIKDSLNDVNVFLKRLNLAAGNIQGVPVNVSVIDIAETVEETVGKTVLQPKFNITSWENCDYNPELGYERVLVDLSAVRSIVEEVVGNSIKHEAKNVCVRFLVSKTTLGVMFEDDAKSRFSVSHYGLFNQLDGSYPGGIGLSIVSSLVHFMEGDMYLSDSKGKFKMLLVFKRGNEIEFD